MRQVVSALVIWFFCASGWANLPTQERMTDDKGDITSYVTKMALIQGHLWVAAQLVEAGDMDLGAKHAKHPAQEVYQELLPFFRQIGSAGFADELDAMSQQLHSANKADFLTSYLRVMAVINGIIADQGLDDAAKLRVARALIAQADIEYRAGVVDDEIADLQEYQDARGFLQIAEKFVVQCAGSARRGRLLDQFQFAKVLWPDLNPEMPILVDPATLSALIGQLEAAAELASP